MGTAELFNSNAFILSTNIKPFHEEKKPKVPDPRPPTPPDLDDLKKDIVDSIKTHFDSCKLLSIFFL